LFLKITHQFFPSLNDHFSCFVCYVSYAVQSFRLSSSWANILQNYFER